MFWQKFKQGEERGCILEIGDCFTRDQFKRF